MFDIYHECCYSEQYVKKISFALPRISQDYFGNTSLAEADMAMAFEYTLDPTYSFNTDFQKQTASYLAAEYMEYINGKNLSVNESAVGFDLNDDGDTDDTVALTIEYDADSHSDTNGYYGSYVDLYLAEFEQSLGDYIARLAYAEDWTWFDANGAALSDSDVAAMTDEDRAEAFITGAYAKGSTGSGIGGMEGVKYSSSAVVISSSGTGIPDASVSRPLTVCGTFTAAIASYSAIVFSVPGMIPEPSQRNVPICRLLSGPDAPALKLIEPSDWPTAQSP